MLLLFIHLCQGSEFSFYAAQGAKEREKLVMAWGLGRHGQGGCGCRGRWAEVGGGWMQKAGEGGASRVEDKEVSDCIHLKILFWQSPHWPDIWFS